MPKEIDEKKDILDRIGDLDGFEIANNELLLAIYMRPEKTAGGIILTPTNLKEDLYQAKAHLVLKIGPGCKFPNLDIKLGDWVVVKPSDAWSMDVIALPNVMDRKLFVPCRMAFDDQIRARLSHPAMVW
jgi:co-chaperonin GroES (HSP10)